MDIIAAYQLVGTYRGAADICGTTHKTVRRVHERIDAGTSRAGRESRPAWAGPLGRAVTVVRISSSRRDDLA
jgi:hypothetical protein